MGIRYWAQPLPAHLVATAHFNPRLLHIDDDYDEYLWSLMEDDADGRLQWGSGRHALNLDKAFNDFQRLWKPSLPVHRPAFELVRGDVTHTHRGWKPYYGVIGPERVGDVRDDVRATTDHDIVRFIESGSERYRGEPESYGRSLIMHRRAMVTFLDQRLEGGEGVLYTIG